MLHHWSYACSSFSNTLCQREGGGGGEEEVCASLLHQYLGIGLLLSAPQDVMSPRSSHQAGIDNVHLSREYQRLLHLRTMQGPLPCCHVRQRVSPAND